MTDESARQPVVVRRATRLDPFSAPDPSARVEIPVVIGRNWTVPGSERKNSGLTRNRVIAGDLPDWAPLPPGELQIKRPRGTSA
jgi:hypothetical protein